VPRGSRWAEAARRGPDRGNCYRPKETIACASRAIASARRSALALGTRLAKSYRASRDARLTVVSLLAALRSDRPGASTPAPPARRRDIQAAKGTGWTR
jgi:hypothetical protein